ncbi:hypothetical protein [Psychrobacillus phage Perkons]|nr:hypothetical protein [Psychrobacillus phage Perkons]
MTVIGFEWNQVDDIVNHLSLTTNKTLLLYDDKYHKYNISTSQFDIVSNSLPTLVQFQTEGMDNLLIPEIKLNSLPLEYEVVTWTNETNTIRNLYLNGNPLPQFIYQLNANTIGGVLDKIKIIESVKIPTDSKMKYLISTDKITWKKWNVTSFTNVNTSSIESISTNGMSFSEISSLTSYNFNSLNSQTFYLGVYLENGNTEIASIDSISYEVGSPKETTQISDAKLYILNTTSTINVSFAGSTVTGTINDEDEGKVQYRVILNEQPYYPSDGSFTPLMPSPLDISLTLSNKDIKIDEPNRIRIEFQDYWGATDYWQPPDFIGTYSGLLFMDETGKYYSTDIGEILQYLDFGVIIAGQTTLEQAIKLRNTYGYTVENINIQANQSNFPTGMKAQFGTESNNFEALDELNLNMQLEDGQETIFYIRLTTQLGVTPQANGEFDILVKADRVE